MHFHFSLRYLLLVVGLIMGLLPCSGQSVNQSLVDSLVRQARQFYDRDMRLEAAGAFRKVAALYLEVNNQEAAIDYSVRQARALFLARDFQTSKSILDSLEQVIQISFGESHRLMADVQNRMAGIFIRKGEFERAREYLFRCLRIRTEIYTQNHVEVGKVFHNIATSWKYQAKFDSAYTYYRKSLEVKLASEFHDSASISNTYNNMAIALMESGDSFKAIEVLHESHVFSNEKKIGFPVAVNLAVCYMKTEQYDLAKKWLDSAHNLQKLGLNRSPKAYGFVLFNLGEYHLNTGDYLKSLQYYSQSYRIRDSLYTTAHPELAHSLNGIGMAYDRMKNTEQAYLYFMRARDHWDQLPAHEGRIAKPYSLNNIALELMDLGKPHEGIELLRENFIRTKTNALPETQIALSAFNLASGYLKARKAKKAEPLLREALASYKATFGESHPSMARTYLQLGEVAGSQGQFEEAARFVHLGLNALTEDTFPGFQLHGTSLPSTWIDSWKAIELLSAKGHWLLSMYHNSNDLKTGEAALAHFEEAVHILTRPSLHTRLNESKQIHLTKGVNAFVGGVRTAYHLYRHSGDARYWEVAYRISALSKANILSQSVTESRAKSFAGIPEELLEQEKLLRAGVAYYQEKAWEARSNDGNYEKWESKAFEAQEELHRLVTQFEQSYPEYFTLKYKEPEIDIDAVRRHLDSKQEGLIEFFWGHQFAFVFYLDGKDERFYRVSKDSIWPDFIPIRQAISGYVDGMGNPEEDSTFTGNCRQLYQQLLSPLEPVWNTKSLQSFVIIRDGALYYVPFEMLMHKGNEGKGLPTGPEPYLLAGAPIRYEFASSFLVSQPQSELARKLYAGFAPDFSSASGIAENRYPGITRSGFSLSPLLYAQEEITVVGRGLKGKLYSGKMATESSFKAHAGTYRILHLATHAILNDSLPQYSWIAFESTDSEDGFLRASEIYPMNLNADLVVLSACNTGMGTYRLGEGMISLGYAFKYAGCRNIVMSLWPVDDKATRIIMERFFLQLEAGIGKDEALRRAKVHYLSEAPGDKVHPYYWAGFVLVGDNEPVEFTSRTWAPWQVLAGILLIALVVWGLASLVSSSRHSVT